MLYNILKIGFSIQCMRNTIIANAHVVLELLRRLYLIVLIKYITILLLVRIL